jgi:hypothetical protein
MAWTDEIAKKLGMQISFVNNVTDKIGVRGQKHSDGSYEIQDSYVPKLKTACRIVQKDDYFFNTLDKLKLAIQILEKMVVGRTIISNSLQRKEHLCLLIF